MNSLFFVLSLLFAFASQALAFEIAVGDAIFKTSEILAIPESPVKTACSANCTIASQRITECNDDRTCLCRTDVYASVLGCQTCQLHYLIATNTRAPDPRVGSNVLMMGYVANCTEINPQVTVALGAAALPLPANWDGPLVSVLPLGGAIVAVITAGILGGGALFLLSNM
ncbi:hypothetical protein H1R20_g16107, partial [Candolleomyces eurysporus]